MKLKRLDPGKRRSVRVRVGPITSYLAKNQAAPMPLGYKTEVVRHLHLIMCRLALQLDLEAVNEPSDNNLDLHCGHVLAKTHPGALAPGEHHLLNLGSAGVDSPISIDPAAGIELLRVWEVGRVSLCRVRLHRDESLDDTR